MKMPSFAGVSPFSRRSAAIAAAKAEGEDDKDEKDNKSKKAEGDEDKSDEDDKDKTKKGKKAEGDEDESDKDNKKSKKAEGDEDESEEDKEKSKKSKKAEGEDEEDDDEPEASAAAVARIRASERKRVRAIVSSEAGLANPDAAYELAVNSDMPTANAIAMLRAVGPARAQTPAKDKLRDRMASTQQPDIGAGGDEAPAPGDPKALAAAIINAGKKRRGEKD
jgi:hypothetical protein